MPTFNNGESGASVREKINEAINKIEGIETSLVNINAKLDALYGVVIPFSLFANGEQGAWYDPSDLTTLYQDAAGTTPVTADGDPVGYMADKSGNGNHATQDTAAARPVYRTDGTLHWLEPDKVDDHMTVGVAGDFNFLHDGTGCEWFFAQKLDDVTDPSTLSLGWVTGNTATKNVGSHFGFDDRTVFNKVSAYRYVINRGVDGESAFSEVIDNTVPDLSKTYVFNGGHASARTPNYFAFLDKAEVYSGDYSNPPSTADSFHPLTLFARAENDSHMGGRFFGALFIGRVLTDTERANARAFLASKSGVTL